MPQRGESVAVPPPALIAEDESKGTGVIYNEIGETTPVPFDSSKQKPVRNTEPSGY